MTWLKPRWRWVAFNLTALSILAFVLTQGSTDWNRPDTFDRGLESGKWGIRFLLICLTMTPLHIYLRWSSAVKLRKSAGLWAFAFGAVHLLQYAIDTWEPNNIYRASVTPWAWLTWPMQLYITLGLLSLLILTTLAITSNKWSMRRLGKNWKRLHRLVYCAGITIIVHALLASTMSKKVMVRDPQAVPELQLYLGILAVLLVIRIPQVRPRLLKLVAMLRPQARTVETVAPRVLPSRTPVQSPTLHTPREVLTLNDLPDPADVGGERQFVEEVENPPLSIPLPHVPVEASSQSQPRAREPREREKVY